MLTSQPRVVRPSVDPTFDRRTHLHSDAPGGDVWRHGAVDDAASRVIC